MASEHGGEPASVSALLGAAGACPEIPFKGKAYKVGHPTQAAKARLEQLVVAQAVAEVRELKGVLPPDAYAELFAETAEKVRGRSFKTWGADWQKTVFAPENAHLFLLSLLRGPHPDMSEADARAMMLEAPEECALALGLVVPDFFEMLLADRPLSPEDRAKVGAALSEARSRLTSPTRSTP